MVSPGIWTIGTHHASPMLARSAPCAIAMRSPSPVLFGGETAPCMGPRRKACTRTGIPFEAAGAQDDAAAGAHVDAPSGPGDAHTGDFPVLGDELLGPRIGARCHPDVQQTLEQSGDQRGAGDAQIAGSFVDRRVQAGSGLGIETDVGPVGGKRGDPVAQSPSWARSNGAALSERPPVGCPPGSSGW